MKKAAEAGFKIELPRRTFLQMAACAAALPVSRFAWAQSYPSRPVRIVVGLTAGSASDIVARIMGQWLSGRTVRACTHKLGHWPNVRSWGEPGTPRWRE
jgi:hypothetical protein